ncbi:hypothetical protein [Deinococcus arenicola]|uniref:hypothetical protein n=1 Tax=Deinococcus arenicola TaxID=2994950 RepID=UPI002954DED7|nr:hypothetical protein [Deinococcus sp. ZS9-10]
MVDLHVNAEVRTSPEAGIPELTLRLIRLALKAPDLGSAMIPVLDALVAQTSAVGAGYFQLGEQSLSYHARAAQRLHAGGTDHGRPAGPRSAVQPAPDSGAGRLA